MVRILSLYREVRRASQIKTFFWPKLKQVRARDVDTWANENLRQREDKEPRP